MAATLKNPPPTTPSFLVSFPRPHILLVTINRQHAMNSITMAGHAEGAELFEWFDEEPNLRVAVVTGAGTRSFCAGQDLIDLNKRKTTKASEEDAASTTEKIGPLGVPPAGFMGISRRVGKKPIIAAVNGFALGGGFEICLNCDIVVASPTASFGLPEVAVGLYAGAGGLPRLVQTSGMHIATEIAITGRRLTAVEARSHQLINRIAKTQDSVLPEALDLAERIASLSPDAIIVTRHGLRQAWSSGSVEQAFLETVQKYNDALFSGENFRIGVEAFAKKEKPKWVNSKL